MREYGFIHGNAVLPFKSEALAGLKFYPEMICFTDEQLISFDKETAAYSEVIPADMHNRLIARGELQGSVAIAKAEKTNHLRAEEIRQVRDYLNTHPGLAGLEYSSVPATKKSEIRKEYDKLEYFNILKTYRWVSDPANFTSDSLSVEKIIEIHKMLTKGLDEFKDKIEAFNQYRSGELRDSNDIEAFGEWKPVNFELVPDGLQELSDYYKQHKNLQGLNLFTAALYALHPFDNGNKRLCRILEHGLMRTLGLNMQNMYSPLHYYHENMDRFYSNLKKSMLTGNMTHAMNLSREAIFFSQLYVRLYMVEKNRENLIKEANPAETLKRFYNLFVKNKSIQHKNLPKYTKKIPARTMNEFLSRGVSDCVLLRTVLGKSVYYSMNTTCSEETFIEDRILDNKHILTFIPPSLENSILPKNTSWSGLRMAKSLEKVSSYGRPQKVFTRAERELLKSLEKTHEVKAGADNGLSCRR